MTTVKERPILMTGESVRAILDGRKTQTRRVVKGMPECDIAGAYFDAYCGGNGWGWWTADNRLCNAHGESRCPYGKPGDLLWVKETWGVKSYREYDPSGAFSMATGEMCPVYKVACPGVPDESWRSPMFMPRWASRLTLEITDVRVQRLHEISESDAEAEVLKPVQGPLHTSMWEYSGSFGGQFDDPVSAYRFLWDRINGKKHPWASNPWVWAITFNVVA
jgi:hypothetical protein